MQPSETTKIDVPTKRLLKISEVCDFVGLSRATIYRRVDSGDFPRPVQLSARRIAWLTREVTEWFREREEAR